MDNLPKNQSDDLSSYSGTYPEEKPAVEGGSPVVPPASVPQESPVSGAVSPFVTEPVISSATSTAENPPSAATIPQSEATVPFVATAEPLPSEPTIPSSSPSIPPPPPPQPENPFVVSAEAAPVSPPAQRGVRRIIAVIALIIALLVIGFLAFTVIGKLIARNQPIVLQYWGLWENEQVLTPLIEEYQKTHPNTQIVYTKQNIKQYEERLQSAFDREEGPDIFRFHNTWVPMLRNNMAPSGSTGYQLNDFQQTFYPVASSDLVSGGQILGIPLEFDGLGLYYNEDLLRSAGVTPPTTWEEFRNAALQLTVKDSAGQIVTSGAALGTANNVEHFSDILALMMLQNGADLKNPSSVEGQQALSFYRLFAEKPGNVWDETLDNSILAFANGKVAFIFAPSWEVFTIREDNPQLKFRIIPIPQLPGTNISWASYWAEGVSNKSTHKDEAWEFLKFLSSKESMVALYSEQSKLRAFGEPYSRVDLAQTVIDDPFVGAYVKQAQTAQSFYLSSRTFDNGINDKMIKYLEDAVNSQGQGVSGEAALQTVSAGFAQVLSSYGLSAGK